MLFLFLVCVLNFIFTHSRNTFLLFYDLLNKIFFAFFGLHFEIDSFIHFFSVFLIFRIDNVFPWSWNPFCYLLNLSNECLSLFCFDWKRFVGFPSKIDIFSRARTTTYSHWVLHLIYSPYIHTIKLSNIDI